MVGAQRVDHDEHDVRCSGRGRRPRGRRRVLRDRHEPGSPAPHHREEKDADSGAPGTREDAATRLGAAERTPHDHGEPAGNHRRARLHEEGPRALRQAFEEHVAHDAEPSEGKTERRPHTSERDGKSLAAHERSREAGAETERASDGTVRHQRPGERG